MRILHVVHAYPPSIGGCQRLVEQLSQRLVRSHGDEVTVFTTVARHTDHFVRDDGEALPATTEERDGVTVRRFPVFNRLTRSRMLLASLSYRWRLPGHELFRTLLNGPIVFGLSGAVSRSGADVVMASAFPLLHMYAAVRGARRAGVPCVLLGALHVEDEWNYGREMIFSAIRRADAYLALTEFERRHVIARGAAAERVWVVGGGVELPGARSEEATARLPLAPGDGPVVTMLAKHVGRKRFDVLIRAMELVWKEASEARLVVAGASTSYTQEIETMLAELGNRRGQAHLLCDLEETEKNALLAASDVLVLPSAVDSFGLVFLEAWAHGKPVVGIAADAIASVIDDGENGLLVAYEDPDELARAILRLLDDPGLRRRMGEHGRAKVERSYTWELVTRKVRAVYDNAIRHRWRDRASEDDGR
ncbi:MAG TPA: glycosyltransferase family 4 protein [Thermoanaerobaculia bacterium]|nr:glycosyltransferase family 4 protein [Thermoanaerobaculia bacterium]